MFVSLISCNLWVGNYTSQSNYFPIIRVLGWRALTNSNRKNTFNWNVSGSDSDLLCVNHLYTSQTHSSTDDWSTLHFKQWKFSNDRVNCIRCTNESLIWGWGLEIQNFVVDAVSIYLSHSLSLSCSLCSVVLFRWIFESCVNLSRFRINLNRIYDEENESRVQFVQREPTKIKEGWWCYQWCRFGFFLLLHKRKPFSHLACGFRFHFD